MDEPVVTEAADTPKGWLDYLPTLTSVRDGILIVAGVDFVLGYLTIAYGASQNKLGFVPPVQAQCLLAGLIPTIIFGLALGMSLSWAWVSERIAVWIVKPNSAVGQLIRILCVGGSPYVLLFTINHFKVEGTIINFIAITGVMYMVPMSFSASFARRMRRDQKRLGIDKPIQDPSKLASLDEEVRQNHDYINRVVLHVAKHRRRQLALSLLWFVPIAILGWPGIFQTLPQEFGGWSRALPMWT